MIITKNISSIASYAISKVADENERARARMANRNKLSFGSKIEIIPIIVNMENWVNNIQNFLLPTDLKKYKSITGDHKNLRV